MGRYSAKPDPTVGDWTYRLGGVRLRERSPQAHRFVFGSGRHFRWLSNSAVSGLCARDPMLSVIEALRSVVTARARKRNGISRSSPVA
jgi:hypothetical protein